MFQHHHRRRRGWLAPVRNFFDRIGYGWWKFRRNLAKIFDLRWLTSRLGHLFHYLMNGIRYPFHIIGWLLRQFWNVLKAWWQIRNFRFLIRGLPALAAIVGVIVVGAYTALRSEDGLQEMYRRNAEEARARAEKDREKLCLERLIALQLQNDPKRQETQYHLGVVCYEKGEAQRSHALITSISDPESPDGFPEAHLYMASAILQRGFQPNRGYTQEQIDLVERHLRRALAKKPDHKDVNALLGRVLAHSNRAGIDRSEEALPYLLKSDPRDVQARIELASIYRKQGKNELAAYHAQPTLDFLLNAGSSDIDKVIIKIELSKVYVILEEYEKAVEVMQQGLLQKKNNPHYRAQLSNIYLAWHQRLSMPTARPTPDREINRLNMLINALEADPNNTIALKFLVQFMSRAGNDANQRAQAHLELLAKRGRNAYLHLWLGEKLYVEGRFEEARKEWELAFQYNPDSPTIANNFAWILTHGDKRAPVLNPDLLRALSIIDQLLANTSKEYPHRPQFHGTRGTILAMMGRYREAYDELHLAAQKKDAENDPVLQQQLANVCTRLGLHNEASMHQKFFNEFIKRNRTEAQPGQPAPGGQTN